MKILVPVLLFSVVFHISAGATPAFWEVRKLYHKSDALLLDRYHQVIHELRVDSQGRRLDWVPLAEISPTMQSILLKVEDRRFYEHSGVDWWAMGSAFVQALWQRSPRGASTITMQLASLLNSDLRPQRSRRSIVQKWRQMREAWSIERDWTKEEILEAYLNLVTFRSELQGIAAAARGLFEKEPHGLDETEAIILTTLIRAPNAALGSVASRACGLSNALKLQTDCVNIVAKVQEVLRGPYFIKPRVTLAPHVAWQLLPSLLSGTGERETSVVSTLDKALQQFVLETLQRHLRTVEAQNVQDGAVLVVENRSGDVLAYVGNAGDLASARYVDGIQARRQAGSILKPFLYGLAFESRILTPASLIEDSPLDVSVFGGIYRPANYDNQFHGLVTARVALASSLNVPAVKTINLVGVEAFVHTLRQLGFQDLQRADFYGPSLALGSVDVSLWDLVNAYRTLANDGEKSDVRMTFNQNIRSSHQRIFSEQVAFLLSDILSDRESRSKTFSLESPLATRFWSAVKTGTSKDMRDNWCVGFTDRYTVGVWTGNFSGAPMRNVSGITGAAPVWLDIMRWLHRNQPSQPKKPPKGVVRQEIPLPPGEQRRQEWFLQGTEPMPLNSPLRLPFHRIVYPVPDAIIALDPDIPPALQRLFFTAYPPAPSLRWVLDGAELGFADAALAWNPVPGQHSLALIDQHNTLIDTVRFEVR